MLLTPLKCLNNVGCVAPISKYISEEDSLHILREKNQRDKLHYSLHTAHVNLLNELLRLQGHSLSGKLTSIIFFLLFLDFMLIFFSPKKRMKEITDEEKVVVVVLAV